MEEMEEGDWDPNFEEVEQMEDWDLENYEEEEN